MVYRSYMVYNDLIPYAGYLWAWYKIDEGSGYTLRNSAVVADKAPDLTVYGNLTTFWTTLAGFGYGNGTNIYANYESTIPFHTRDGYEAGACFSRVTGNTAGASGLLDASSSLVSTTSGDCYILYGYYGGPPSALFIVADGVVDYSGYIPQASYLNRWVFTFMTAVKNNGTYTMETQVCLDDGTLFTPSASTTSTLFTTRQIKRLSVFRGYWSGSGGWTYFMGEIGDVLWYVNKDMTLTEWGVWYDNLRSRYGMAARVGW